jgi:hypothetical protein
MLLKHFQLRWQNLKPLLRIVEAFIAPLGDVDGAVRIDPPAARDVQGDGSASHSIPEIPNDLTFKFHSQEAPNFDIDPMEGDFFFDFDSFELHPATMWAYRPSIPNSPR